MWKKNIYIIFRNINDCQIYLITYNWRFLGAWKIINKAKLVKNKKD